MLKPRICLIVSTPMTVSAFLIEPIKSLLKDFDVDVITNLNGPLRLQGLEGLVKVHSVALVRKLNVWADLRALHRILQILRHGNYFAVHSVTPKAGLLGMMAAFIARVPNRTHTFTGQVWATKKGLERSFYKNIDRILAFFTTQVIVDSPSQRDFLQMESVIAKEHAIVFGHGSISGVDIQRFNSNITQRAKLRAEFGCSDDDVLVLFLGRLNRDKGIADLLMAYEKLPQQHVHLLIVGPDEEGLLPRVLSVNARDPGRVHYVSYTGQPEWYMSAADIFCLPSYREGFGNVVIEAAAVGIPTVASRIYGLSDAVVDNQTGLLFEAGNIEDLVDKLTCLVADRDKRRRMGTNARSRVVDCFSSEVLSKHWENYYKSLK